MQHFICMFLLKTKHKLARDIESHPFNKIIDEGIEGG